MSMKIKWTLKRLTLGGRLIANLKLGKSLPVLRKQHKLVTDEFNSSVSNAENEKNNLDSCHFEDDPDDSLMYAEGLVSELNRASQLKMLLDDIEEAIEELEG